MSGEYIPPKTRREALTRERLSLYQSLDSAMKGYQDLLSGAISSYSLGNRSITRSQPDMNTLSAFITRTQNRIAEIEAIMNGRPIRNTSRYVFIDPSMIGKRW